MRRSRERLWAQLTNQARRLQLQARQLFGAEIDDIADKRAVQVAEAQALANSAAELRGGVAKVAQLRAYLQGSAALGGLDGEAQLLLRRLWDDVPGDRPAAIRQLIAAELGVAAAPLLAEFEDSPFAAASLGQVHGGRLADGQELAIKVQYPGIAAALRDDLASLPLLRQLVGGNLGDAVTTAAVAALRDRLLSELDYVAEAESLRRFKRDFASDPTVVIPTVYPQLSTARILTMQRLRGRSLPQLMVDGSTPDRSAAAATIFRFAFRSAWRHGWLNLDPNPGNYLLLQAEIAYPRGPQGVRLAQVGFVDFGCTFELPPEIVEADRALFLAIIHRDGEELRYAAHRCGLIRKAQAQTFDSTNYRSWEQLLSAPFLTTEPAELHPSWARELTDQTWRLLKTGRIALAPAALLLWRQRLGVLAVLAGLRPRLPLRRLLADLLDDGVNPVPLYERYR